jgi:hypothetical protein
MQNFAVAEFSVSQEGQRRVNGDTHSPQYFARSGFSAPHFQQRIAPSLISTRAHETTCSLWLRRSRCLRLS